MANAIAATFDESTNYFVRAAGFSGAAESKLITLAAWVYPDSTNSLALGNIVRNDGDGYQFTWTKSTDLFNVRLENNAGTQILNVNSDTPFTLDAWNCVLFSADLGSSSVNMYFGDTEVADTPAVGPTDDLIELDKGQDTVGGNHVGAALWAGALSIIWMDFGQAVDFSSQANRRLFYGPNGKVPSDFANSSDGNVGGLGSPILFLNTAPTSYESNGGTGGDLTENGTSSSTTGPEIESNVLVRRRREVITAF